MHRDGDVPDLPCLGVFVTELHMTTRSTRWLVPVFAENLHQIAPGEIASHVSREERWAVVFVLASNFVWVDSKLFEELGFILD